MNESNQIPNDIRRRLETMSLQELKAMHAKTLEMMEKWQLKPASPSLENSFSIAKNDHPIIKRIEGIDNTKQNEFIVGTPGSAKNYRFEPENEKPTIDIDDLEKSLDYGETKEFEMYDLTEQKKVILTAWKDIDDDDNEFTYLVNPNYAVSSLDMLNDKNYVPYKDIEELGKRLEDYLENEHGVTTTPFMEYKNGEFHFEKDEGNVSFKIVEGKDDHFEIHIENEDYEDGWEPFTDFHKDELDLEPEPEREQMEEIHELNIEFR